MLINFTASAAKDFAYWEKTNPSIYKRIGMLIKAIEVNPFTGIGKPEKLTGNLTGMYSRRINHEHRLVYGYKNGQLIIYSCRYHYS